MSKTAIITGATKGIGKAIAYKYLQEGYHIAICARNQEDLDALTKTWQATFPLQKIVACIADFEQEAAVKAFAAKVLEAFETIDVLINNAGIFLAGTVLEEEKEQLRRQMEVNVFSAYTMSKIMASKMQAQGNGHIINICSIAGLHPYAGGSSYSISKYAMLGMSDNFRTALKPYKIKVTAVCPGPTMSHSWEGSGISEAQLMPAEDIADLVYNCSQMSLNTCVERLTINPLSDL